MTPELGDVTDFIKRYDEGAPQDGIADDEARSQYERATKNMSDDDYEMSAEEAFTRMTPKERRKLGRMMRDRGRERRVEFNDLDGDGDDDRYENPKTLAKMARRAKQKDPGLLGGLLGGGDGGLGKGVLAGIAASAFKKLSS